MTQSVFIVTRIRQFRVSADSEEAAVSLVISGHGELLNEQDVPNRQVTPAPIPRDRWPSWAREFAVLSHPGDKGIGDVIVRVVGDERSYGFKTWMKKTLNRTCAGGCVENLNSIYPLP